MSKHCLMSVNFRAGHESSEITPSEELALGALEGEGFIHAFGTIESEATGAIYLSWVMFEMDGEDIAQAAAEAVLRMIALGFPDPEGIEGVSHSEVVVRR